MGQVINKIEYTHRLNEEVLLKITLYPKGKVLSMLRPDFVVKTEIIAINNEKKQLYFSQEEDQNLDTIYYKEMLSMNQITEELVPYYKKNINLIKKT